MNLLNYSLPLEMLYMLFVCADIITKDNKKIVHDKVLQGKNKLHYTH